MKSILNKSIIALMLIAITTSCGNSSENEKDTNSKKELTYLDAKTTIQWTAYKTTEKIGVKGTFNEFRIENKDKVSSIEEIINTTKFRIPTASVFSGNAPRDILIKTYFFGAMMNTDTIYGNFISAKDGKGQVAIKMNNVEFENNFTYSFKNDSLKINATLLLDNWNGYTALSSLHEQCFDKHTGPDGVSKTWPDVDLEIISVLK
ncbi:MAG: hypothetical protein KAG37_03705 [Flavobacteriales bacterium]|nr:hypothetical protein [Flavobacteriales bacterium]